jgi:hypothetical protein
MNIVGKARGEVVLASDLETVYHYFADHKKILGFNPLCKKVSETEYENVFRWDFEITDPRAHPIRLIFYVEQQSNPTLRTDDIISPDLFAKKILWIPVPIEFESGNSPDDHTFIGLANGSMEIKKHADGKTFVDVTMCVTVDFDVPVLLRVFPEPIIKVMAEVAMSAGMQQVSNKMLENISKDFQFSIVRSEHSGNVTFN